MDNVIKSWIVILVILFGIILFELGYYLSQEKNSQIISNIVMANSNVVNSLEGKLGSSQQSISGLTSDISNSLRKEENLNNQIQELEGEVAGLQDNRAYPFKVPSEGTIGSYSGTFGGLMYGKRHWAIDIWTTTNNSGALPSHKGNPVYAACSGKVVRIFPDNAALIIQCNDISSKYDVPKHSGVFTYYGHLGNKSTKKLFITVGNQQRVKKGQLIGYQGDLSSFYPDMSNVHLHFSIFTGNSESDNQGGSVNPCLYIGGDCARAGSEF